MIDVGEFQSRRCNYCWETQHDDELPMARSLVILTRTVHELLGLTRVWNKHTSSTQTP